MSYIRDHAIILRSVPFREQDRMITLFGRSHGLLEAVARGVGVRTSKQAGHLTPMTEVDIMIAKGSAFDKLAVARIKTHHRLLRSRLGSLAFVGSFMNLFERLQKPGIVDYDAYDLLRAVLRVSESMPDEPSAERAKLLYATAALKLLDRIGFAPALSHCASCREELRIGECYMLPHTATLTCADCYRVLRNKHPHAECVHARVLKLIRFLREEPLDQVLLLSGESEEFACTSRTIALALKVTPLEREPHGLQTIYALLT